MRYLFVILFVSASINVFSQNQSCSDHEYQDSTEVLLNKYLDKRYVFVGESHYGSSNFAFQSEIIAYYLEHGFNAVVIERGYAETYLLNKAIHEKDKALINKIWSTDFLLNKELMLYILDSVMDKSISNLKIIGIDYEQSAEFTKWVLNDVLFSCNLVQSTNVTPRNSRISNMVYLDYEPPLVFLNDTIKNFYDEINSDEVIDLQKFDSLYGCILFNEIKYRKWFKGQFELVLRCINAVRMSAYEDCFGVNDTNICNKREVCMFENFLKYVIADSLKSIGVFGSSHILKLDNYTDTLGQNYKSFVAMLVTQGYSVASFFPVYSSRRFRKYHYENENCFHIDEKQLIYLQSRRGKLPFLLYEQPNNSGWEKSKSLFDLIIVTGK